MRETDRDRREQRIYSVVRRIPRGKVATYGQVAVLAGLPGGARQVGRALSRLDAEDVPWQRVVNAQGRISARASPGIVEPLQKQLLESEGVVFGRGDRIDLDLFLWEE